jgi:prepilin-type N-terminal cleavage/methylation domain-containing protein
MKMVVQTRAQRGASRGFSLVEIAIALVILGMLSLLFVSFWRSAAQHTRTQTERDLLIDTQKALVGFAHANSRLPCPAVDHGGQESCDAGAQTGWLPWKTLGIADAIAMNLKYGVERAPNATSPFLDQDLAVAKDRLVPLFTLGSPPILPAAPIVGGLLGNTNLIDLCYALNIASGTPAAASRLAVMSSRGGTSVRRGMAFVVAAPGLLDADGDGNAFDGRNASASAADPTFEAAERPQDAAYDDRVAAMDVDTLFAELDCGEGLSAISQSHVNAATAAAFMKQALIDYKRQLQILVLVADGGVASGTAGVLSAAAGLSSAVADSANAVAFTILTYGGAGAVIAPAVAAIVSNTIAVGLSATALAKSVASKLEADQRVIDVQPLVDNSAALWTSVDANARTADQLGF